jgi:hypothetical protein
MTTPAQLGAINAAGGVSGQYPQAPTTPVNAATSGNRETLGDALANARAATAAGITQPKGPITAATGSPTAGEVTIAQAKAQAMKTGTAATTLATTPAANLTGGQNQYTVGDTYVPSTTLTGVANPQNPSALAFEQATTGANAVPYQVNEYLNDFEIIANMIANGGPTG